MDPGLYLMYSPMLEIFPCLRDQSEVLACGKAGSNFLAWFFGSVAELTMAVESMDLAEVFAAFLSVLIVGREKDCTAVE